MNLPSLSPLEELYADAVAALNRGDTRSMLAHYHDDAVVLAYSGVHLQGYPCIAPHFAELIAASVDVAVRVSPLTESSTTKVATKVWSLALRGPDGTWREHTGQGIVVFTSKADHRWRIAVDTYRL